MQSNVITSEYVMNRLKNVNLEDYSKDDLIERYIVYGSESEFLVVEKSESQLYVAGFLKKYEDIDYKFKE